MSKEMVQKLYRLCDEEHIDILEPVLMDKNINPRFQNNRLSFLEKICFDIIKCFIIIRMTVMQSIFMRAATPKRRSTVCCE